mgnify:CR=1 FL=1
MAVSPDPGGSCGALDAQSLEVLCQHLGIVHPAVVRIPSVGRPQLQVVPGADDDRVVRHADPFDERPGSGENLPGVVGGRIGPDLAVSEDAEAVPSAELAPEVSFSADEPGDGSDDRRNEEA